MRFNPAIAKQRMKQRANTPVTFTWVEYPVNAVTDPTTVAYDLAGVEHTVSFNAFVHFIGPTTSTARMFAEVETGDCIVDMPCTLMRVTAPVGTSLEVGQVLTDYALSMANRAMVDELLFATAEELDVKSLKNVTATIGGQKWVQKTVGKELSQSWDAMVGTTRMCQSFLFRKAT